MILSNFSEQPCMDCTATAVVSPTGIEGEPAPNLRQAYLDDVWSKYASAIRRQPRCKAILLLRPVPKLSARAMQASTEQHPFDLPLGESQRKICNLICSSYCVPEDLWQDGKIFFFVFIYLHPCFTRWVL